MKKIIGLDVDGVVLDLISEWLKLYNSDWNDSLTPKDMLEWNIHQFVKPDCGYKIYEYLENPNIYNDVKFIDGSVNGVIVLKELGFRVVFVTSSAIGHAGVKARILKNSGLLTNMKDYMEVSDKSLVMTDFLVDDSPENIAGAWGTPVVFDAPYNQMVDGVKRVYNWTDIVKYFIVQKNLEMYNG